MQKYCLDILEVSEAHLRGCGEKEVGGRVIVYLGAIEGRVKGSMTVLISENIGAWALEWRWES